MVQTEEGSFTLKDGTKLYTKTWKPESTPTAALIFLHGFSDHCNAYYEFFPTLSSPTYSIQVHAFDQRGWGRSVHQNSDKGNTGPTSQVLADINEFVLSVSTSAPGLPIFVMGHSMGGGEALHYLLTPTPTRPPIAGLMLEAPYIALHPASEPFALTVLLGKLAARIAPTRQLVQKLDSKYVCRNPQVQSNWANDALCHDTGTLQGMAGMLQRGADLVSLSEGKSASVSTLSLKVPCPFWLGHGTDDRLTSYPASKKLFEAVEVDKGDKTFKSYESAYHMLHAEPDGVAEQYTKDVGEWIVERATGGGKAAQPKL